MTGSDRPYRVGGPSWVNALAAGIVLGGCSSPTSNTASFGKQEAGTDGAESDGGARTFPSGDGSAYVGLGSSGNGSSSGRGGSGNGSSSGSGGSGSGGAGSSGGATDAGGLGQSIGSSGGGSSGSSSNGAGSGGSSDAGSDAGNNCGVVQGGGPFTTTTTHLDIGVHDPSMIWDGNRYYLLATGGTLNIRSSADMLTWNNAGNLFTSVPAWVSTAVGSAVTDLWAPDISYFGGLFHVYYAASTFGTNKSVIGLATSAALASPKWDDLGLIAQSTSTDNFNAIDPNVSFDQDCTPWLAFGSFWSGVKMRRLDATTGKLAADDTMLYSLAARPGSSGDAIEAASIVSHHGYYYLFVSFDACCKGVSSTYNTNYGRATKITGPYINKAGTPMLQGGAELLLSSAGRYIGPGGGSAWKDGSNYFYVYHYYDGQANGASKLQIRPITFDATDWITLGNPVFP